MGLFVIGLTVCHTIPAFNDLEKEAFDENIVGIGENAGNQHFHKMFYTFFFSCFSATFILMPASPLNLDQSKILLFDKGFNPLPDDKF